jgi:hypothetical protein
MMEAYWGTTNIKTASAVAAVGGKLRTLDPVTRTIKESGETQVTFWFEAGIGGEVKAEMERPWSEMKSDPESNVRYMRACLENRETLLGLVKRSPAPLRVIQRGGQTLLVSENATSEQRRAILKHL